MFFAPNRSEAFRRHGPGKKETTASRNTKVAAKDVLAVGSLAVEGDYGTWSQESASAETMKTRKVG